MKKLIPFIYFLAAVFLIINAFLIFSKDQESYRLIFSITTESKYSFLSFRVVFALLVIWAGANRLKRQRDL